MHLLYTTHSYHGCSRRLCSSCCRISRRRSSSCCSISRRLSSSCCRISRRLSSSCRFHEVGDGRCDQVHRYATLNLVCVVVLCCVVWCCVVLCCVVWCGVVWCVVLCCVVVSGWSRRPKAPLACVSVRRVGKINWELPVSIHTRESYIMLVCRVSQIPPDAW